MTFWGRGTRPVVAYLSQGQDFAVPHRQPVVVWGMFECVPGFDPSVVIGRGRASSK